MTQGSREADNEAGMPLFAASTISVASTISKPRLQPM